jgi:hypothetical protein
MMTLSFIKRLTQRIAQVLRQKRVTEQTRAIDRCFGCSQLPMMTSRASNLYDVECCTFDCPAPSRTSETLRERSLDEAVLEWNAIQRQRLHDAQQTKALDLTSFVRERASRARFEKRSRFPSDPAVLLTRDDALLSASRERFDSGSEMMRAV